MTFTTPHSSICGTSFTNTRVPESLPEEQTHFGMNEAQVTGQESTETKPKRNVPTNELLGLETSPCGTSSDSLQNTSTWLRAESAIRKPGQTLSSDKDYQCRYCSKEFTHHGKLTKHLRTHKRRTPFQSTQCSKAFSRQGSLIVHLRTHTGEKPYQCTQCSKAFSTKGTLSTHLHIYTTDPGNNDFKTS